MEWNQISTQYGAKLEIDLFAGGEFDQNVVNAIKSCDWDITHRSYDPETQNWTIDLNAESIHEFEQQLGVNVPAKFKEDEDGTVEIDLMPTRFLVQGPTEAHRLLSNEFSYQMPDAEYTTSYQRGTWDGMIHVYDNKVAPVGLLDRAVEVLEESGFDVKISDPSSETGDDVDFNWEFEHNLRYYQIESITRAQDRDRGVIALPTGAGKTITALGLTFNLKKKTLVVVHTQELLHQWADNVEETLGVEAGKIGDGEWYEGDEITIAIGQSLISRGADELEENYGVVFFDECHRTSAAENFHDIALEVDARKRYGLSATPWRRVAGEELLMEGVVGSQIYHVSAEQMIDEGYLAEPAFETLDHSGDTANKHEEYSDAYARCIEFGVERNSEIVSEAAKMAREGRKVLVSVNRVSQAYMIASALRGSSLEEDEIRSDKLDDARRCFDQMPGKDIGAAALTSGSGDRQDVLDEFEDGDVDVLVSTLVREGVDLPAIDGIILADGLKSDIVTIQVIGRALRPSGGNAKVVDVEDRGAYFGSAHQERQTTLENYYGGYYE